MSHLVQHQFRFAPEKITPSATKAWFVFAALALAATFGFTSLIEPSAQATPPSSPGAPKAREAQPLKLDLAPVRALTEPALREEDLDMTSLRPHGG